MPGADDVQWGRRPKDAATPADGHSLSDHELLRRELADVAERLRAVRALAVGHGENPDAVAAALDGADEALATAVEQARCLALQDQLTGLPNRRLFEDRLDQALGLAKRRGHNGAVVYIDVDNFAQVNIERGRDAGDQVLIEVSMRLRSLLRTSDTVARLAGDEFTMLLPEVTDDEALDRVTARVCSAFDRQMMIQGELLVVRASVGVAYFPSRGSTVHSVLAEANREMFAMKTALRDASWWSQPAGPALGE